MLVVGFPAVAFGTNCFVLAPEAGEECVVVDPGIGVADQLDESSASTGSDPSPSCSPTATSTTRSRSPRCARLAGSARTCTQPTRRCSPTRRSACRAETVAMLDASGLTYTEPDDVVPAR